jgi:hypothetical protein
MSEIITFPASNRRAFLTRALAGVAGATIAAGTGNATPPADDDRWRSIGAVAASIVASDPVPGLVDEYFRLEAEVNRSETEEDSDRAFELEEAITERVVDMVASSAASILAQIRLLHNFIDTGTNWNDDRDNRLLAAIGAGVERLSVGGVA